MLKICTSNFPIGYPSEKGEPGPTGLKGEIGNQGIPGFKGEQGDTL